MSPIRRGKPKTMTLEYEAAEILERLAGHTKAYGQLVSHLLRQEERRRQEMRELRQRLTAMVEEGLVP
jgi:hypothetical protein